MPETADPAGAGPDMRAIGRAVRLACRFPSVHNSQPWRWVAGPGPMHPFVDRRRAVPGTDCSGRQTILSCGAVLDHLRVVMNSWEPRITP